MLFSSMLSHGFSPHSMILGTMIPIPKDTQCTFSMLETIDHYNVMKSNTFVLMLDASKAFDRVNYCKLFRELLKRELCPLVLRLLLFMYTNQTLRVKWGSVMSESFTVMNGVKQGSVLSPVLFEYILMGYY